MRKTPNLNMTVYEPVIDDEQQFDLNVAINQNLDILDGTVAAKEGSLKNTETSTTIGDTDTLPYVEAATARKTKRITFAKVKDTLNAYFADLFAAKSHAATHSKGGSDPISISASDIGAAASKHAANHASGGSDAITPADIKAVPASRTIAGRALTSDITLTAADIGGGTFKGQTVANALAQTSLTTAQLRDSRMSTTDLTAGTSSLATGTIYYVYE